MPWKRLRIPHNTAAALLCARFFKDGGSYWSDFLTSSGRVGALPDALRTSSYPPQCCCSLSFLKDAGSYGFGGSSLTLSGRIGGCDGVRATAARSYYIKEWSPRLAGVFSRPRRRLVCHPSRPGAQPCLELPRPMELFPPKPIYRLLYAPCSTRGALLVGFIHDFVTLPLWRHCLGFSYLGGVIF